MSLSAIVQKRTKWLAGCRVHGCASGEPLPPPNRRVDQSRIDLDQPGSAFCSLGCNEGRAAAREWIEDDPLPIRTVADRIGHKANRFGPRVRPKCAFRTPWNFLTCVVPNIGPITNALAEPDIIDVRRGSDFEHEHELMLGSIKRSRPSLGLAPHTEIRHLCVDFLRRGKEPVQLAPI